VGSVVGKGGGYRGHGPHPGLDASRARAAPGRLAR
jgi:hypothetical protein